jgi:hypothetical protein
MLFINDLSEALGAHISDHTFNGLLYPICAKAQEEKGKNKPWTLDDFKKVIWEKMHEFYDCAVGQVSNLFLIIMAVIEAKMPIYLQ